MSALKLPLASKSTRISLTSSMLEIIVGTNPSAQHFTIHEGVLTNRAIFFRKAMSNNWKEAEEKLLRLPDDEPDIFDLYLQLAYTGRIPVFATETPRCHLSSSSPTICADPNACQQEFTSLAKLYVLAEKLQDVTAKNSTVEAILAKVLQERSILSYNKTSVCLPGPEAARIMYDGTPCHCPGRQVFVDAYVYYGNPFSMQMNLPSHDVVPEFLHGICSTALRCRTRDRYSAPEDKKERYFEDEGGEREWSMEAWPEIFE